MLTIKYYSKLKLYRRGPFHLGAPDVRLVRNRAKGNSQELLLTCRVLRERSLKKTVHWPDAQRRGDGASGPIQTNHKSLTTRVARGLSDRGSEP
ncbi:hypothetical protein AVEN_204725-1 [Araneus ventricosus]|uniref:Uncharacterized protein n=1 Tax=Araneus ventricosus TaxID=182803 RepID=A0A4Y2H3S1_ARAVE|nr:hypothetical protein AVEN_204725-1 [Araneus ventricosus]